MGLYNSKPYCIFYGGGGTKARGGRKEKGAGRKERVDRRFLDDAGHESLSMRDLLDEATSDDNDTE